MVLKIIYGCNNEKEQLGSTLNVACYRQFVDYFKTTRQYKWARDMGMQIDSDICDKVFKSGLSKFCGRQHLKVNKGFSTTIAFLNSSSLFSKLSNQVWGILKSYWFNTKLSLPKFMKNSILAVYPYVFKP